MTREQALVFGDGGLLFGILALPEVIDSTRPAVLIPNNGTDHRTGPGRMHVELARALAAAGFVSLRLDKSGLGDSESSLRAPTSSALAPTPELCAAMDVLDERLQSRGYVVAGFGPGAHDAHEAATVDPRIVGAVFFDGYTHHTPRYWINRAVNRFGSSSRTPEASSRMHLTPKSGDALHDALPGEIHFYSIPTTKQMQSDLSDFIRRNLDLLFIFSGAVEPDYNYAAQLLDAFPVLRSYPKVTLHHLPEADSTFGHRTTREAVIALVLNWLLAATGRSAS